MTILTLMLLFFRASKYLDENIGFPWNGESIDGGFYMIWVAVNSGGCEGNSVIRCLWFWHLAWRRRLASWGGDEHS